MKLSTDWHDFRAKLDKITHARVSQHNCPLTIAVMTKRMAAKAYNERGRQLRRGAEPCELTRYRRGLGAWSDWEDEQMVSTDHFRQELLAQLGRAAAQGRIDILINSGELYRSIARGGSRSGSCCDAMQEEFKMGDRLLLDRTNGSGMTVRYLLPRAN
jgi:hypothetical protein